MASILLTPAATPCSERILKAWIEEEFSTWVPPQSSIEKSPTETTLTVSPYFSPNNAVAPDFLASSMGISRVSTTSPLAISSLTKFSTFSSSSLVKAVKCVKSKRRRLSS